MVSRNSNVTKRFYNFVLMKKGGLYGSSFLNVRYRDHLTKRLEGERHSIENSGYTKSGIIEYHVREFENSIKRRLDVTDKRLPNERITIQGLEKNDEKGFVKNNLIMSR
jgi:hypothetical protein